MDYLNQLGAAFGFDLKTVVIIILLTIPFVMASIGAIVHAASREYNTDGQKMLWVLVSGIPFFGFIAYFLIGIRKGWKPGSR
jgi:hypothetical protein